MIGPSRPAPSDRRSRRACSVQRHLAQLGDLDAIGRPILPQLGQMACTGTESRHDGKGHGTRHRRSRVEYGITPINMPSFTNGATDHCQCQCPYGYRVLRTRYYCTTLSAPSTRPSTQPYQYPKPGNCCREDQRPEGEGKAMTPLGLPSSPLAKAPYLGKAPNPPAPNPHSNSQTLTANCAAENTQLPSHHPSIVTIKGPPSSHCRLHRTGKTIRSGLHLHNRCPISSTVLYSTLSSQSFISLQRQERPQKVESFSRTIIRSRTKDRYSTVKYSVQTIPSCIAPQMPWISDSVTAAWNAPRVVARSCIKATELDFWCHGNGRSNCAVLITHP